MGHLREQLTLLLVILVGGCQGRPLEIGTLDASTPDADTLSWPVPGQRNARSLRSEGPYLYWLANEPGQSAIRRCEKRDCGHTLTEVMRAAGDPELMGFELRGDALYLVAEDRISSCALHNCQAPKTIVSDVEPLAVAYDDERVYWSQRSHAKTFACSLTGCKEPPTLIDAGTVVLELVVSGAHLYGIAADAQYPGSPVSIVSAPKDGSAGFTVLAARQNQAAALTVTDGFVYWSTSDSLGTIARCPLAGCTSDEPRLIIEGQDYPHFISPSGDAIFWMNGPSAPDSSTSIERRVQIIGCRIASCSSSRDVLEEGNGGGFAARARATQKSFEAFALPAREMVVDAEAIYWLGDIVNAAPSGPPGRETDASLRRTQRRPAP